MTTEVIIALIILIMIFSGIALLIVKNIIKIAEEDKNLVLENISDDLKIISIKNISDSLHKALEQLGIQHERNIDNINNEDLIKEFNHYYQYNLNEVDKTSLKYQYYANIKKLLSKEVKFLSKM